MAADRPPDDPMDGHDPSGARENFDVPVASADEATPDVRRDLSPRTKAILDGSYFYSLGAAKPLFAGPSCRWPRPRWQIERAAREPRKSDRNR